MAKIRRNAPCPCGSGRKYKQCCALSSEIPRPAKHDGVDGLMNKGYSLLSDYKIGQACDMWLELWEDLKTRFKPEFKIIDEAETLCSCINYLTNWCQDLESELGNAGLADSVYYEKRIAYCDEFCALFPGSDELMLHNMKRASAESCFSLGKIDEGTERFQKLIDQYPQNIWGYIGWGDMYLWPKIKAVKPDYERAEQLYMLAFGKEMKEEDVLQERLEALKYAREHQPVN